MCARDSDFGEFLDGAAEEAEKVVEQEEGNYDEDGGNDDSDRGVRGGEPGKPYREQIFAKAERPIAEGLRRHVGGGSRAGFGAMRSKRDASGEQRGSPTPGFGSGSGSAKSQQGRGGRTDEGVHRLPDGIDVGHFVGEKLDDIQDSGNAKHDGIRKHVKLRGKMDDAEAFQQAEGRDGSVKIKTRGKTGAENQADCFERIHGLAIPCVAVDGKIAWKSALRTNPSFLRGRSPLPQGPIRRDPSRIRVN
jgi:hypothetical protein